MKKMTKKDRVENYIESLMKAEGYTVEKLMNMTVYDLFGNTELKGIGKTTLSGALNSFKKKHGLKKAGKGGIIMHKNTKKERVERYLANLMKTDDFSVDDLMNLTVYDLFGNAELEGIGKTTLSSGISAFKKKYLKIQYDEKAVEANSLLIEGHVEEEIEEELSEEGGSEEEDDAPIDDQELFENAIISTLEKEGESKPVDNKVKPEIIAENLDTVEIDVLKTMINQFKSKSKEPESSGASVELTELRRALKHFGIEYKTILAQYRKSIEN
ncbi:hypothetical protein KJ966_22025 [bacterium]|nr:hypothetical protein [bacterium]